MRRLRWLLPLFLPALLSAQTTVRVTPDLTQPLPLAYTECADDSTGRHFTIHTLPHSTTAILVHELTHVAQITHFPTCHDAIARYNGDARFRFLVELDAYCAEARVEQVNGELVTDPFPESLVPFHIYMFLSYGRGFGDLDDTQNLIAERCPILVGF